MPLDDRPALKYIIYLNFSDLPYGKLAVLTCNQMHFYIIKCEVKCEE